MSLAIASIEVRPLITALQQGHFEFGICQITKGQCFPERLYYNDRLAHVGCFTDTTIHNNSTVCHYMYSFMIVIVFSPCEKLNPVTIVAYVLFLGLHPKYDL